MAVPYPVINDTPPWTQTIAGLNQYIYSTNWTADTASDILVYSRPSNFPANDVLQLVPSSQYTVQFIGEENIVQVTFLSPYNPPQYYIVTIMRDTPSDRLNLYTNTNFTPSMLNSDFGTLTLVDQDNQLYWQQIVPRYNNSETVNVPIDTILPILQANQFWAKNSTNTAFVAIDVSQGGGSGGAPANAPYITYGPNSTLSEAFNLGTLTDGLLAQNSADDVAVPYSIDLPLPVASGGTGVESIAAYSVLVGGVTDTSPIVPLSDIGADGQVLTSSGSGMPPSWQDVPSSSSQFLDTTALGPFTFTTSNTIQSFASLSVPAGNWNLDFFVLLGQSSVPTGITQCGISNSASSFGYGTGIGTCYINNVSLPVNGAISMSGHIRIQLETTTPIYFVGLAQFSGTAPVIYCQMTAQSY